MTTALPREPTSDPLPTGEVGVLIARQVDPGHEKEFERWAHGVLDTATSFPGHLGYGLFRPARPGGPWFLVHRFRDAEACADWQNSPERADWFSRAGSGHREIERRHLTGLEGWFPPRDRTAGPGGEGPAGAEPGTDSPEPEGAVASAMPARWKMTLTAALGIFPVSLLSGAVLQPALSPVPLLIRTALIALFFSGLMSYAVMPALTRTLHRWLYPR
ncbi:antibiotic biosynthesis monooxygenase [Streptomyces sp. NBC_01506]|uniref:antibiotic biosynthesis monooxygenase n=1 Tax=Streptomyces sp. NBC_01506 TaxID=2903887 RepID=UPI00386ADB98